MDKSLHYNIGHSSDSTAAAVHTVDSSFTFKVNRLFCHIHAPHALTANFPKRFVRCCTWFQDSGSKLLLAAVAHANPLSALVLVVREKKKKKKILGIVTPCMPWFSSSDLTSLTPNCISESAAWHGECSTLMLHLCFINVGGKPQQQR